MSKSSSQLPSNNPFGHLTLLFFNISELKPISFHLGMQNSFQCYEYKHRGFRSKMGDYFRFPFSKIHFDMKRVETCLFRFDDEIRFFPNTSGKLWLKMRRMSIISPVLHIFVSSLRLKHGMHLIQRTLGSPGLVDYFSYPHHG